MAIPTGGVHLVGVSLDGAHPVELADFSVHLLNARLAWSHPHSTGIPVGGSDAGSSSGGVLLIAQRVDDYQPPARPGPRSCTWTSAPAIRGLSRGRDLDG